MNLKKIFNDEAGVSPIVATLVLVVVAIAGAAAVGTIMGSFSSDVADGASVGDATSAASTELLIAGSSTVQPVSELLAEAYMEDHQGIKVTVQGGGSGAGVSSVAMGISDIGAASRAVKDKELAKYPDIQTHQIGGSAVVIIANNDLKGDLGTYNITMTDLVDLYVNGSTTVNTVTVNPIQRAEASGTEDTFVDFIGSDIDAAVEGAVGNAGVLAAVQDDLTGIAFVDYGFADDASDVFVMGIDDEDGHSFASADITADAIMDEFNADNDYYIHDLTRPLNYLTNGEPTAMQQAFITFAQSPGATEHFTAVGYFALNEIA